MPAHSEGVLMVSWESKEGNGQEIEGKEESDSLFSTPPADTNLEALLYLLLFPYIHITPWQIISY